MSVEKHYEVMEHVVVERVCIGETTYCDVCKKMIDTNKGYWELTTGHHDWAMIAVTVSKTLMCVPRFVL